MSDHDQALRRALTDALRSSEPASTPSFSRLWAAAQLPVEPEPGAFSRWTETLTAGAAVASVVVMGILIAINVRKSNTANVSDTTLYAQLIAQTSWQSPTDALLDSSARFSLAGLPELPVVNTNPSLESLL